MATLSIQSSMGRDLHNRVKQAMYQKGIPFDKIDAFIDKKGE